MCSCIFAETNSFNSYKVFWGDCGALVVNRNPPVVPRAPK